MSDLSALRIAVIGGGIGGLAASHFLTSRGLKPVVFEASSQLGGLGTYFEHRSHFFERFYHIVVDSDADLVSLLAEIGLEQHLVWNESRLGFLTGGRLYPLSSALDLLRFCPLSFSARIRTGLAGLYLRASGGEMTHLDAIRVQVWLRQLFGSQVTAKIWEPLLRAKFGEGWADVPAYYLWNRLRREKGSGKEVKGYVKGGYKAVVEGLAKSIQGRGGCIRLEDAVESIELTEGGVAVTARGRSEIYDYCISTIPMPGLPRLLRGELAREVPSHNLQYQGVVNVLVISKKLLLPYYWTAVVEPAFGFQGMVETTNVIPVEWTGGLHLVYLLCYAPASSPFYQLEDDILTARGLSALSNTFPQFREADIDAVRVFRAPFVEPVWPLRYLDQYPPQQIGSQRVFLCTTAHSYPKANSWNTMVGLARKTVDSLLAAAERANPVERSAN